MKEQAETLKNVCECQMMQKMHNCGFYLHWLLVIFYTGFSSATKTAVA